MEQEQYIKSLENLLIFMCKTYEETHQSLRELYKSEQNEAAFKVPVIQGTSNAISIGYMANLAFENPELGFYQIHKHIQEKRELSSTDSKPDNT